MARVQKIVFLMTSFFNQRYFEILGVQTLIDNGFEVEVWDLTNFLATDLYKQVQIPDLLEWEGLVRLQTEGETIRAINRLPSSCVVIPINLHYNADTLKIYRALSRRDIQYFVLASIIPISSTKKDTLRKRMRRFNFRVLFNYLLTRIPYGLIGIKSADIILAPGDKYLSSGYPINSNSKLLWIHSPDYDEYLKNRNDPPLIEGEYCVFLDEYRPFHQDNEHYGVPHTLDPEAYYSALCEFFDHIERKFSCPVVIAAHPKSMYENRPDYFRGRPCFRGKTGVLIRNCGFVIMHQSTAINHAIIYKKPIVFTTSKSINASLIEDPSPDWLAGYFGKKAIYLDSGYDLDLGSYLTIDESAYGQYKNDFIKKNGTADLPRWQIVADYIKGMGQACRPIRQRIARQ